MFPPKEYFRSLSFFLFVTVLFSGGCSQKYAAPGGKEYVAIVNGYKISMEEFKRKLGKFHSVKNIGERVNPNLATVDYFGILDALINERLMIEEARRFGFQGVPEYQTSHRYSKVNLALKLLKIDEVGEKVEVLEDELERSIRKRYETVEVWHLFAKSERKAKELLQELKGGALFESLVVEKSDDPPAVKNAKGFIGTRQRVQLAEELREPAFSLKEGEFSDVISTWRGYHILKVGKRYVPEIGYQERKRISDKIFAEHAEVRERTFFEELRREYDVHLNEDVLGLMTLARKEEKQKPDEGLVVATVRGEPVLADEIYDRLAVYEAKSEEEFEKGKRHILDGLVTQKMLDMEIEKRNYYTDPRFIKEFTLTEDFLYLDFFKNIVIGENVILGKGEALAYYNNNQSEFRKPMKFRLSAILVTEKDQANETMKELDKGGDFGTLARDISVDKSSRQKGDVGWISVTELPDDITSALKKGRVKSVQGPFKTNDGFLILRIEDMEEGKVKSFKSVREGLEKKLSGEKYQKTFLRYIEDLRKGASVSINEKFVQRYIDSKNKVNQVSGKNK